MAIDLASVRARVKATGLFLSVSDVSAMADALDTSFRPPAAFVALPAETAEPNSRVTGPHRQQVRARLSIIFALKAQKADQERSDEIEAFRTVLRGHLSGWTPTGADLPLDYATSIIRAIDNGMIWVEMLFDTKYHFSPMV